MNQQQQQQQQYAIAQQRYNDLCKISEEKQTAILASWNWHDKNDPCNDIDLEKQAEVITHMEFELGIFEAEKAYRDTQRELIAWGLEHVKTLPGYNPIIATLAQSKLTHHRTRLAELLLKLPA